MLKCNLKVLFWKQPAWHLTRNPFNILYLFMLKVYERAVGNLPPAMEKRYWQRYIYLWIKYALFEELDAEEPERAREVYRACLKLIPHQILTFSKVERG